MQWTSLLTLALVAPSVYATHMLRFGCSQLVTQRLDPIVGSGSAPFGHMHQIIGGDGFNTTMNTTQDVSTEASCTTCSFNEDFSNYWTPVMYFRATNGSFKRVPQIANQYLGSVGGMTVYYMTPDDTTTNITAFKPGFRMLAGKASQRTQGYGGFNLYRCYTGKNFEPNPMGVSANDTYEFPKQYCAGGIRVNLNFPNCWDGKNLDSADHQSHVAFGYSGCPNTHPVQLPQIMIETVWNTGVFDQSDWPTDGSQPFVWSQGDPTGYGHHADYVFGWKGNSLQKAMDARCDIGNCPELTTQPQATANKCNQKQIVVEDLDAWLPKLPGGMNVTTV